METFVFEITDKINKLAKKLGINVGYWTQSSRGFSHIEYCGLYVGEIDQDSQLIHFMGLVMTEEDQHTVRSI